MKTTLKLTFAAAAAAFMLLGANTVNAQGKFGYINSQELITAMPESDSIQTKLLDLEKELQNQLTIMRTEFTNKAQSFQSNLNDLSETVLKQKEKEINDLRVRIESFEQDAQQEFQTKQQELFIPVMEKAQTAISKVSKEQGLIAVFDLSSRTLVYQDDSKMVNILPLVKKSLGITK